LAQHRFTIYRILCSSPDDLEPEQTVFHEVLSRFAEEVTMPESILFPAASFRAPFDAKANKAAVESNIRACDFFLQIFGDTVPDSVYRGFLDYAIQCATDPAQTMRRTAILCKAPGEQTRDLRASLSGRTDVHLFHDHEELTQTVRAVLEGWYGIVKPAARAASTEH
jgi:hypothetical protein